MKAQEDFGHYTIDGSCQQTFNESFDRMLASLLEDSNDQGCLLQCLKCGHAQEPKSEGESYVCELCGHETAEIIRPERIEKR